MSDEQRHHRGISAWAQFATLSAALLGWMFDGFEMGLFPLTGKPALQELLTGAGTSAAEADQWFGVIMAVFLVGAASGGVLFGWLGDKIGRVRAMSLSIVTYALLTGLCGLATEAWHIAVLRFFASLGMGGEWSLGVALVNEMWPGKSRAFIAGLIGSAANVGFLLVALLSIELAQVVDQIRLLLLDVGLSAETAESLVRNSAWRFLMITGAVPALLIFFIRLFVPESSSWQEEHAAGKTSNWSNADLIAVMIGCLSAIGIVVIWSPIASSLNLSKVTLGLLTAGGLITALFGFLHPVRQYLVRSTAAGVVNGETRRRIIGRMLFGASLAGIALLGTWGSLQWAPKWSADLPPENINQEILGRKLSEFPIQFTQIFIAIGAIISTILAAIAAGRFGRRRTYAALCAGSLASACFFYGMHDKFGYAYLFAAFLAGGITASFYGFFPLYFPELFPTSVRATAQGFAFNFGRIIAAIGGLQTSNLIEYFGNSFPKAGMTMAGIYILGILVIWLGPETKSTGLPQ